MPMPSIDWDVLRIAYNDRFHTAFPDVPSMLAMLYSTIGTTRAAELLGVAMGSFQDALHCYNIPMRPAGGRREANGFIRRATFLSLQTEAMTLHEIMTSLCCGKSWALKLLKRHGRTCKDVKPKIRATCRHGYPLSEQCHKCLKERLVYDN